MEQGIEICKELDSLFTNNNVFSHGQKSVSMYDIPQDFLTVPVPRRGCSNVTVFGGRRLSISDVVSVTSVLTEEQIFEQNRIRSILAECETIIHRKQSYNRRQFKRLIYSKVSESNI